MRTIGLEEHFVTPELVGYGASAETIARPDKWAEAGRKLLDLFDGRIDEMDASGLDLQVLSLNSPGIQAEPDAKLATSRSIAVNDFLAETVTKRPDRFHGFAALALQDPQSAADELERSVTELGFHGALVNAHTQGRYLDDRAYDVVWERAQALDVPLYLHPANGVNTSDVFSGHPELTGPMWSWGVDTATHALRLIFGGVFDRFPQSKLLLGHMGEGLPYALWRLDSRWDFHNRHGVELELEYPSKYIRRNIWVTTSGVCSEPPLRCAIDALGADRVLFATDHPFEEIATAVDFIHTADITEDERSLITHRNAELLLGIPAFSAASN